MLIDTTRDKSLSHLLPSSPLPRFLPRYHGSKKFSLHTLQIPPYQGSACMSEYRSHSLRINLTGKVLQITSNIEALANQLKVSPRILKRSDRMVTEAIDYVTSLDKIINHLSQGTRKPVAQDMLMTLRRTTTPNRPNGGLLN